MMMGLNNKCIFCAKMFRSQKHLCAKMYTYENIFKRFLMSIYLSAKPKSGVEFFDLVMKTIAENGIFAESPDPSDVVRENLIYFLSEYDCF